MLTTANTPTTPGDALQMLIESLSVDMQETLRVAAIPHVLDSGLAEMLWPGNSAAQLMAIKRFPFYREITPGQWELYALARRPLLESWRKRDPETFRTISRALSQELFRRVRTQPELSLNNATEALYHALAADPAEGMRKTSSLFHELLASWQIGSAERLVRLTREQEQWLDGEIAFLDYFAARLSFTRYEKLLPGTVVSLQQLATDQPNSLLAACILRLLGQNAVWQRQWEAGRLYLKDSLQISQQANDLENQALTTIVLGDLFYQMAENSGGILVQNREFAGRWHAFLYVLTHGPLLIYRYLAARVEWLPNFYGSNYQNWVAVHILHDALICYRAARSMFRKLNNQRRLVEIDASMARVLLALGYPASAMHLSKASLKDPLVASSPYDTARLQTVIGQIEQENGRLEIAADYLEKSLAVFNAYGDAEREAETALVLGGGREKQGLLDAAVHAYRTCLNAAKHCSGLLMETEVYHRLRRLALWGSSSSETETDLPNESRAPVDETSKGAQARLDAADLCGEIQRTAYIDRYPGKVQKIFQRLSQWLVFPLMFVFIVTSILAGMVAMQVMEGELRGNLPPVTWSDVPALLLALFLPVLTIWLYYLLYFLLGQVVVFSLSFSQLDADPPQTYELDEIGITRTGRMGEPVRTLAWNQIQRVVIDERSLFRSPLTFSARVILQDGGKPLELPASIFRWKELKAEVERRLASLTVPPRIEHIYLSILRSRWLWISLLVGLGLGAVMQSGLLGPPSYGCYTELANEAITECPEQYRLYIQPLVQVGLFLSSVLFLIVTAIRWQLANRRSRRALAQSAHRQMAE